MSCDSLQNPTQVTIKQVYQRNHWPYCPIFFLSTFSPQDVAKPPENENEARICEMSVDDQRVK